MKFLSTKWLTDERLASIALSAAVTFAAIYTITFAANGWGGPQEWGQFGDYLGGLVNPVCGIVTAFLVVRTLRATRKEAKSTRRQLRKQIKLGKKELKVVDAQRLLEGILTSYYDALDSREYEGQMDVFVNGVSATHSQKFKYIFLRPDVQSEVDASLDATGQFPERFRAEWRTGASAIIHLLEEMSQACEDYEKLVRSARYTNYFRRRVWLATNLLGSVGAIDNELFESLCPPAVRGISMPDDPDGFVSR